MCDKEMLVALLYEELQGSERRDAERHLASCAECREEMRGLRATRMHLGSWASPENDLGLQIVRRAAPAAPRFRVAPAWGLAAAAVLVLAAAAAVARLEIRAGSEGVVVRTGWNAPSPVQQPLPTVPVAADAALRAELESVQQRLRDLEGEVAARAASDDVVTANPDVRTDYSGLLRQVRQLVQQSETRQQRELALRIGQVVRDLDTARRADLIRIQQGLAQIQGRTDETLIRQQRMEHTFLRAVHQQER